MSYIEKEKLIKADIASIENRVRHAFNQGYDLGYKEGKKKAKSQEQEPTPKNDCETCIHNKGILECDMYGCKYEPTTKNDLGVDAVSRKAVINQIFYSTDNNGDVVLGSALRERIARLPSVTPQLSSGLEKNSKKLEKNFGELDCISRADARKAIIDHQYSDSFCEEHNIDHSINTGMALIALSDLPSVTPQEPKIVPIAEIKYDKDKLKELVNKAVLTVTPQEPRWIPCSEKKPNKGGEYLLWGKICDDDEEEYCFLGDYYEFEEKFGIEKSNYDPHTLGFLDTEIEEYYSVVAWMPLPKPYKAESEE